MSAKATAWAWELPIEQAPKLLTLALSELADYYGRVKVSLDDIAKRCGLTVTEVEQLLTKMQDDNLLVWLPAEIKHYIRGWDHICLMLNRELNPSLNRRVNNG